MVDAFITDNGRKIRMYRTYTPTASLSATTYNAPTKFKIGTDSGTPSAADNDLDVIIPITSGTVLDDGDNTFTGSNGGDNSTDNTTTYKPGAQTSDDTAQNLIANGTSATKTWTIANLATAGTNASAAQYTGLWLYVKDATALAKLKTSGTCFEIRLGSDTSNYYSLVQTAADLAVGWNWITSSGILSTWTQTGTVAGNIDTFILIATTNNSTDTFVAGDLVYDLLRQWQYSDTIKAFVTGYPSIDNSLFMVTTDMFVNSVQAVGYNVDSVLVLNEDTSPLSFFEAVMTAESKTDLEELTFETRDLHL